MPIDENRRQVSKTVQVKVNREMVESFFFILQGKIKAYSRLLIVFWAFFRKKNNIKLFRVFKYEFKSNFTLLFGTL